MRWTREQYLDLMCFRQAERPMLVELFGPLVGLEEEWRAQGATDAEINLTAFDFDTIDLVSAGANTGAFGGFERRVLEETADYLIESDNLGRVTKLMKGRATIGHCIKTPVTDFESWEKLKPFFLFCEERVDLEQARKAKEAQKRGAIVRAGMPGAFDLPRLLLGEELACTMCYEEPDLIRDILMTAHDTTMKTLERVTDVVSVDVFSMHEDMAGKSGPLWGPKQVLEFGKPFYRPVCDMLRSRGTRLFSLDSDGDIAPVIPALMECGINCVYPNEPAAGMDIVALRKRFGRELALKGGIDKFIMRQGKAAIDKELEYKLSPDVRLGTCFGLDHRIPNGSSLENYRYYVNRAREILDLPPVGSEPGWVRMAF